MYKVVTIADAPDLRDALLRLHAEAWPDFLGHDAGIKRRWSTLYSTFPGSQFVLRDAGGAVVGAGNTVPLPWDGTRDGLPASIAEVLERALGDRRPTVLCALAAIVSPAHRGQGLSREIVETMRGIAARHGLGALIAPVRPTHKARYPLTPMERFVTWTRADGAPFDPWLRVHWRLGAETLKVAPEAMVVEGTVAEWEAWTRMCFPESGAYVVPGALQPVVIDRDGDRGRYADPNVWMRHPVG